MARPIRTRHVRLPFAAAVVTLALVAGCSSDSKSSSSTTPATSTPESSTDGTSGSGSGDNAELCAARADLRTSIEDLQNVDFVKNGTSGITDAITTIKDNLANVKEAASDELKPQVTAFEDALSALGTAVSDVGSAGISGVATAAGEVGTTGSALITSLDALSCS